MAKAKKSVPRKGAKPKAAPKAKAAKGERKPRTARSVALPGMGQVRHDRLDDLCANIADDREVMNEKSTAIEESRQAALSYMVQNKVTAYHHSGVELVRVPGAEKLRVRTHKEATTASPVAETDADEAGDDGEGDQG